MLNKFKRIVGGWVKVYETDYDEDGKQKFIVEHGKDGFPAHERKEYTKKKSAVKHYRSAR